MAAEIINNDHWMCRAMGDCWCQQMMSLLCETRDLNTLLEFGEPAAGESAPISPEVPQAHGLTTPATPSAAVGASEPGAGDKPFQLEHGKRYLRRDGKVSGSLKITSSLSDYRETHPFCDPNNGHSYQLDGSFWLSNSADELDLIAEYHEPSPSTPAESPSITVPLTEREKQVLGELSARQELPEDRVMIQALRLYQASMCSIPDIPKASCDQPAESPDDWVTQDRVPARVALDEYRVSGSQSEPGAWKRCIYGTFPIVHGYQHGRPLITGTGNSTLELRCRRKDLPVVPAETPAQQPSCSPVCALCGNIATCFGQYADHDKGFACDSCCGHGNEDGWCMTIGEYDHQNSAPSVHSPALPSPWRPMTEVPTSEWFWSAWDDGKVILSRDRVHWPCPYAIAWMPVEKPLHPNAAPTDKPRMRQVTLREFSLGERSQNVWGELPAFGCVAATGRMFDVEVPE